MSCCKHAVADALRYLTDALVAESRAWRKEVFPPPSKPLLGTTEHKGERLIREMFVEQYQEKFNNLPPKEGHDFDIAKGIFTVTIGEDVVLQEDVLFNLDTREPVGLSNIFEIPKGTEYTKSLAYVDDDGNVSPAASVTQVAVDSTAPNAPTSVGVTAHVGEREVPDA